MIKRITIGNHRLTLTFARVARVIGVNSTLKDGSHILMWDFDDESPDDVKDALKIVQARYCLSDIHLLCTRKWYSFIAYCFTSMPFKRTVEIIAATPLVDWQFLRFGVYRGHFTLRVTPKNNRDIVLYDRLEGCELPNCKPQDLTSWVKYETLSWK